jgi:HAE1 family hydrophobic/amphiphilic exporter-1
MDIIRFSITNPVKVAVAVIFVLLGGWTAVTSIPIQLVPNVDRPIVTVQTRWHGASPQEIEREITEPQEEQLKKVADLYKMTSESDDSRSRITLEFNVGVDKEAALREVSEKLDLVQRYPDGVEERVVEATDARLDSPIAWLHIQAEDGRDISDLESWAEDNIQPRLKRVKGVAGVDVWGGREREVQVIVDPAELAARQLTFRDVELALRAQNTNVSAGTVATGKRDFTYRTIGQYESIDEIANTVIAFRTGGPIYVHQVAEVRNDFRKQYSFIRSRRPGGDGAYSLSLPVRREAGSNVIEVINGRGDRKGVKQRIDEVNAELLHPRGLHLKMNYDESQYIQASINKVRINVFIGALLAIGVLLLFLRSASATAVVAVAIPISAVGTFLGVYVLGRSLNVIMLAGVTFAVGMVVDNAIVVLENIYRHREMGKNLTTMAVFIPVIFVQEEAGQLFRDIAIAVSVGVGLSLIVAVTVIPTLSAKIMRKAKQQTRREGRLAAIIAGVVNRINGSTFARLAVVLILTVGSYVGSRALVPPITYMPAGNPNFVSGRILAPPGYTVDTFRKFAEIIEADLKPYWEAELDSPEYAKLCEKWTAFVRANIVPGFEQRTDLDEAEKQQQIRQWLAPPPPIETFYLGSYYGSGFLGIASKNPDVSRPLANLINSIAPKLPGAYLVASQRSLFGRGVGNSIDLEIIGDDLDEVTEAARVAYALCREKYERVIPDPRSFDQGRPEVRIIPDPEKAADLGLNVRDLGFIVEACVDGARVGEYRDRGDTIDLMLKVDEAYAHGPESVAAVPIVTPGGQIIPVGSAVSVIHTTSPQAINHVEERPAVTLSITAPDGVALESVMDSIERDIIQPLKADGVFSDRVIYNLAGNADKLTQTRNALLGRWEGWKNPASYLNLLQSRIFMALLVTYFLMAALFESFLYPFVVMFSVPLAAIGGFGGLAIVHYLSGLDPTQPVQQMDILTMLGFVLLIGVVVNNAILLVHQARNNMLHAGMSPREAISESVRSRIRPIFMSTMTSVFGMLPLVLVGGAGSELYRGIGSVLVGGLVVSTVFTLLLVPTMFSLVLDVREAVLRMLGRAADRPAPAPARGVIPTTTRQD